MQALRKSFARDHARAAEPPKVHFEPTHDTSKPKGWKPWKDEATGPFPISDFTAVIDTQGDSQLLGNNDDVVSSMVEVKDAKLAGLEPDEVDVCKTLRFTMMG